MSQLAETQRRFAVALRDATAAVPPELIAAGGTGLEDRFSVYRNNVSVALGDALRDAYPVVCRLVGDVFFQAMALHYVAQEPPRSPVMLDYGDGFADFVATFAPASGLPYLADVARIERAWVEAYHAPDATALIASALSGIEPDMFGALRLRLHPSLRIVRSAFPALSIWEANIKDGDPEAMDLDVSGETALIVRPEADVEVRALSAGAAALIGAFGDGDTLAAAAEAALTVDADFDLTGNLAGLLDLGVFAERNIAGLST